jgi:hypothetical protein
MSVLDDDMRIPPKPLDTWTADRLLDGLIAPDDAPPGYAPVARLVIAARRPASAGELAGMDGAVAAAAALLSGRATDRTEIVDRLHNARRAVRAKIAGLVVVGTLVGTSGLAAAGVLPTPIQSAAARVLDTIGIHVPNPHDDQLSPAFATGEQGPSAVAVAASRGHGHDFRDDGGSTDPRYGGHGSNQQGPHGQAGDHGNLEHPTGKPSDPGSTADDHSQPTDPGSQGHGGGGSGQTTPPDQNPNQGSGGGGGGGGGSGGQGADPPTDPGQGQDHGQGGGHDQGDGGGGTGGGGSGDHGGGNGGDKGGAGGAPDNGGGGGTPVDPGGNGGAPEDPGGGNGGGNGGAPEDPGGGNGGGNGAIG